MLECGAIVTTCELPTAIGARGVAHLESLAKSYGISIDARARQLQGDRPGAFLTIWAHYEHGAGGATAMGQKGLRIESLAQSAFQSLTNWMESDATLDQHLPDQVLIPAVLSDGDTTFKTTRLTSRFLTSVWVVKQFLPIHLTVRGKEDGPGTVSIRRSD